MSTFDLEAYISTYSGLTRVKRLQFVGDHSTGDLQLDAYRMAIDELKKGRNTQLYKSIIEKAGNKLGPQYGYDESWVQNTEQNAAKKLEKLEMELNTYKTNLIKESIRIGHSDLGDFLYERGDLAGALKNYMKTRDYATTSKHIIVMCLNVIRVCLDMGNTQLATQFLQKAEQTPEAKEAAVAAKLKCAAGLIELDGKRLYSAAKKFLEVSPELGSNYSEVISSQDVAVYGGLCALASFDRKELKNLVIDNTAFKNFLELAPDIRELIIDFYSSRYTSCLSYLDKLKGDLLLDIHLRSHVETLYEKIRSKALMQYVSPFLTVDLHRMAATFANMDVNQLEKELAKLIMDGTIKARIDSHNKILYASKVDERQNTYNRSLEVGQDFLRDTENQLLRLSMMRNNYVLKGPMMMMGASAGGSSGPEGTRAKRKN